MHTTTTLFKVEAPPRFLRQHYQTIITLWLLLVDVLSIVAGFYLAYRLRLLIPLPEPARSVPGFGQFLPLLLLQVVAIICAFFFGKMYHRRRTRYTGDDLAAIFSGVSIGTLISIAAVTLLLRGDSPAADFPRVMVVYAWLLIIGLVVVGRGIQARIQRALQMRGVGRTRVVVVGAGEPAATVIQRIAHNPRLGYDILGLVTYDGQPPPAGVRILGSLDELSRLVGREAVDEVIIALPNANSEDLLNVIAHCDRSTISIKVLPDQFQIMAGQLSVGELSGLPLLNLRNAAIGALIGAGLFSVIAILGRIAFRRDAMGHGDIKLVRGMGALLLTPGMLVAFGVSVATGAILGGLWAYWRSRHASAPANDAPTPTDEPLPPEPLGNLLASCLLYILWVDALITLLPRRVQQRVYAALGQPDEELADDAFEETPTMLPFGPFLAIGALSVMLFGGTLAAWTRAYFEWAGF